MSNQRLIKNEIANKLKELNHLSFCDIEDIFERFEFDFIKVGTGISFPSNPNVILWTGWNSEATTLLVEAIEEYQLSFKSTEKIVYMVDGKVLPMPLARGFEYPYKTEHWLPTIIIPA